MRALWQEYGRTGRGVGETEMEVLAERISGVRLKRFFAGALYSCADLPLAALLRDFGIKVTLRAAQSASDRGGMSEKREPGEPQAVLGARTEAFGPEVRLTQVFDGGCAQAAGLSAGDVLVAFDGIRVSSANFERLLERRKPGERMHVHAFRRDELIVRELRLLAAPVDTYGLEIDVRAPATRRRLRDAWLKATAGAASRRR